MKYLTKMSVKVLMILAFVTVYNVGVVSAASAPGCDPDLGGDPNDVDCPIDGGLVALLVAGAGVGVLKIRGLQKNGVRQLPANK